MALVDFGAVRDLTRELTHGSTLVGTFGYMPPEQLGGTVDATSDIYALGATLLHGLTGVPPSDLLVDGMELRFDRQLQGVSDELRAFIKKLVAPRRSARFPSAEAALEALRARGQTVLRPDAVKRVKGARSRRSMLVAFAAALSLAGIGLGAALVASNDTGLIAGASEDTQYIPQGGSAPAPVTGGQVVLGPEARGDHRNFWNSTELKGFIRTSLSVSEQYPIDSATTVVALEDPTVLRTLQVGGHVVLEGLRPGASKVVLQKANGEQLRYAITIQ
jgi:serine/threonine protein kinase